MPERTATGTTSKVPDLLWPILGFEMSPYSGFSIALEADPSQNLGFVTPAQLARKLNLKIPLQITVAVVATREGIMREK